MKVKKISIKKFRGFRDVEFELGSQLTVIAGQNGTQKTTILGLLSQTFSLEKSPMRDENPLSGGTYRSFFMDIFRLSKEYDKAGEHEWTLSFSNGETQPPPFTIKSIPRSKKEGTVRFWQKGTKSEGSGYIQLPVIYLSLKRLYPTAEDKKINTSDNISLSEDDFKFYQKWHKDILILTKDSDNITKSDYLYSTNKQTLGASTNHYDWKGNSAGQDNIGKILLAILSFKQLQDKYKEDYKGGILAIDEIDVTFFAGSQIRLIKALRKFADEFNIQIIFTTHSLTILEKVTEFQKEKHQKDRIKIMYLEKVDTQIQIVDTDYNYIKNDLNRTLAGKPKSNKIDVYSEDKECSIFMKSLLGTNKTKHLNFIDVPLGCGNLIDLSSRKIPTFIFPNSIIILDGDVKQEKKKMNRINKIKNILLLPTDKSPEQIISHFLNNLSDTHPLWKSIDVNYGKQYCFQDYPYDKIQKEREVSKKWFNSQIGLWGRNASKVLNVWKKENKELVKQFNIDYDKLYNQFVTKLGL